MKLHFRKKHILCLIAAVLLICGCATSQPQQTTRRYVWPRPPAIPKIEWLKSYYSQNDFPKSGFESAMEVLFGEPDAIGFEKPIDIKSNGNGLVYVTDIVRNAVFVYDLVNFKVRVWKNSGDSDRALAITPYFISLDRESNAYVVGTGDKNIYVLDTNGALKQKISFAETVKSVGGIAVDDARNRIYLVDTGGGKVEVFALSGKHLFSFGKPGEAGGEFNRPQAITVNHKGEIVVGDTMNARIQIFDGEGKFLRKFGQRGDAGPDFQILKGVTVDSEDNIYVADGKANQIKIFSTRGEYLLSFGTAYSVPITRKEAPGGFLLPQGIHIDKNDSIFIADQANMRFQHFRYLKDAEATDKVPDPAGIKK
jgi:Uncharacterized conserved protein